MTGPIRQRRSNRQRRAPNHYQAPVNRNFGQVGRPRNELLELADLMENAENNEVVTIVTPSIPDFSADTFGGLQRKFPTTYAELEKLVTSKIFNVSQAVLGTVYFQLLPQLSPERTEQVATELGTIRSFIAQNGIPQLDEWVGQIGDFQRTVMDQMGQLPKLYIPVEDDEIVQNGIPCAFQLANDSADGMKELSTIWQNYKDLQHPAKLIMMKLIEHPAVEIDFEHLNMGFRICASDQTAFLGSCFEKAKAMVRGPFVCLSCATSFSTLSDIKGHLQKKHRNILDMNLVINRPESQQPARTRELELELENSKAREHIKDQVIIEKDQLLTEKDQKILELEQLVRLLRQQ